MLIDWTGWHTEHFPDVMLLRQPRLSHNMAKENTMFVTHSPFKFPVQLDKTSTVWGAVELADGAPWYLATVIEPVDQCERVFLLSRESDLMQFAAQQPLGKLVALHLMQSPRWSPTEDWNLIPIKGIHRMREPETNYLAVVVTSPDGALYSGFPVERLDEAKAWEMELLIEFDVG